MNPPAWWSPPWWSWFLTIVLAGLVAGLLVPSIRDVVSWAWRKWFQFPVVVFITKWTVGKHDCGHRSGSFVTDANGRRICVKCDQAKYQT
jgi:hypothetical protein